MSTGPAHGPWIDGHLDLAYLAVGGRDLRGRTDGSTGCVDLASLADGGVRVAFGTIFTEPDETADDPYQYRPGDADGAEAAGRRQLDVYRQLESEDALRIVRRIDDLEADGLRLVILMEGADPIRTPEDARWWFEQGLRLVGLTWAMGTRYAGGNAVHGPLTGAGIDLVAALDDLGIVHDASHLADHAFDGLLANTTGRVVATHSNCRALMDGVNQRHLRDDQITAIAERDGVIGLNLYTAFLSSDGRATVDDCVRHVQHVAEVMGHRRGVALGSDMDGGFGPESLPENVDHPTKLGAIADALRDAGWSDDDIAGFTHANWTRFLSETLPR